MYKPTFHLRNLLLLYSALLLSLACVPKGTGKQPASADPTKAITVLDILERELVLQQPAQRIILGEGRFLAAIGMLDREDPTQRVVGMMGEFEKYDPDGYRQLSKAYPKLDTIQRIGNTQEDTVSPEQILALEPDLAIFGIRGHGPGAQSEPLLAVLKKAGIPVVFIDFRDAPLKNTCRSIEILGSLLGKDARAQAFNDFYQSTLSDIRKRLAGLSEERKPVVFLESHVGLNEEGGRTMSHGMMGHLLEAAGGINIAKEVLPGSHGTLDWEFLIDRQPDAYLATAIGNTVTDNPQSHRILLGAGISQAQALHSLKQALQGARRQDLQAVQQGRVLALWHHYYNSPLNIVALQAMAKFLHPDRFHDVSVEETLTRVHERFQPLSLNGCYWISPTDVRQ